MINKSKLKLLSIVLILILAAGCSPLNHLDQYDYSQANIPVEISAGKLADKDYGEAAYAYLEYFESHYPNRESFTEQESVAGDFIISTLFDMGYKNSDIEIQTFSSKPNISDSKSFSRNIILTKQGMSKDIIVVGAHYDCADTNGASDNGSGVAAALESALRMVDMPTDYTIKYIFFGAEERGLLGSDYYVNKLSANDINRIKLMVNVDCVIAGDVKYIYHDTFADYNSKIENEYNAAHINSIHSLALSKKLDMQLPPQGCDPLMSDQYSFEQKGIPNVLFISYNLDIEPSKETVQYGNIMHHPEDDLKEINRLLPARAEQTIADYSELLDCVLTKWKH